MSSPSTLIRGAVLGAGEACDILIRDGLVAEVGSRVTAEADEVVDAEGLVALPGLVDLHTHLRQPGFEEAETVLSGTRAAAAGGYTTVFAMANTAPVADTAGVVEQVLSLGESAGYATVQPIGAVSAGQEGRRLAELGAMASSRARVRVFSDDGHCVSDPLLMRRALEYVRTFDGVVAQHAQEPRLTEGAQMNESAVSSELGLTGWPAVAEEAIIARDVLLAEHVGSRLHVCHVSTAGAVEVVRWAKRRGISVTAEVTPHHLLLTDESVRGFDTRYKVNPPLRTNDDVTALRQALADGTIDVVATDHAPHPREAKEREWDAAPCGMVGLESALSVVQRSMVDTGLADYDDVARFMSSRPAEIGHVGDVAGRIDEGRRADIVLYDPSTTRSWSTADLSGRSVNSPYVGLSLPGRVVMTMHGGIATVRDGAVVEQMSVAASERRA